MLFLYGSVADVRVLVPVLAEVGEVVVFQTETEVPGLVEGYAGLRGGEEEVAADVEFFVLEEEWALDVFLDDELLRGYEVLLGFEGLLARGEIVRVDFESLPLEMLELALELENVVDDGDPAALVEVSGLEDPGALRLRVHERHLVSEHVQVVGLREVALPELPPPEHREGLQERALVGDDLHDVRDVRDELRAVLAQ